MSYKRVLTIQDISCVGQCSLTVALPIISACGLETAILPSAVLSTHTAGFSGYTFRDLTDDMPDLCAHWQSEGIKFDTVYTGYLGSIKQIEYVADIYSKTKKDNSLLIVDPAMADNGKLYPGFTDEFVTAMAGLCARADYVVPNITEAVMMCGMEYKTAHTREYIDEIIARLTAMGVKSLILTGVSYREGTTGVVVYENNEYRYYEHKLLPNSCHGTGDIYASAFVGAITRGRDAYTSAMIAADFVMECIKRTADEDNHWYGAVFETELGKLIKMLG